MVTANPTGAVIRPQQLQQGQQRIALHRPGVIQSQPRQTIALQPGTVRTPSGQIVVQGVKYITKVPVMASYH